MKLLLSLLLVVAFRILSLVSHNVFDCGVSQADTNELILHGYHTVRGEWPWHVAIYQIVEGKERYVCGGTLVTKLHVITEKHCLLGYDPDRLLSVENVFARLGMYRLDSKEMDVQHRMVRKIHKVDNSGDNIAIAELTTEAEFGKFVQPACISLTKKFIGQLGLVIGWGIDESDTISNELKSARLPVVDTYACLRSDKKTFAEMLKESMFCAGYTNGTTICNGDGGGGFFFKENGAWHLGGINFGVAQRDDGTNRCYKNGYGVFIRIYTYLAWIRSVTKLNLPVDKDRTGTNDIEENSNFANLFPRYCGINNMKRTAEKNDTYLLEFPWMAILRYENYADIDASFVGTLVHKRYVLATASGTAPDAPPYQVRLGEYTIGQFKDCNAEHTECSPTTKDYGIEHIIRHPKATYSKNIWNNDIALIRLDRDVKFEVHIQPVCLPVTETLRKLVPAQYIVTGWKLYHSSNPLKLVKTTVKHSQISCQDTQRTTDASPKSLLCMDQSAACFMSVGSPLGAYVDYNENRFVQLGLFLYDVHCNYSAFLSTAHYIDWILGNIKP